MQKGNPQFFGLWRFGKIRTLLLLLVLVQCHSRPNAGLVIATAANVQFAMNEICTQFETETGIHCDLIISSSGKLTAQIREGAPYDVFISADMKYPKQLYGLGLTLDEPVTYARGNLVLWSLKDSEISMEDLRDPAIEYIALANAKMAPYGVAAEQVLDHYKLREQLQGKLVFGESISQTNQFLISGAADIGFTAKSVVLSPQMKDKGSWIEIESSIYDPIQQGVVVLKRDPEKIPEAIEFYRFLFSETARTILRDYGYGVN